MNDKIAMKMSNDEQCLVLNLETEGITITTDDSSLINFVFRSLSERFWFM
jgi:hypothetical protein